MWVGLADQFHEYGFSYWATEAASGFDRLSALGPLFQTDTLLFLISPGWLATGLAGFVQRFVAGYFTYRLCRDHLKLGELASLIAGLAYSTCFFYFQSGFAGAAGFPLILWTLEYVHQKKGLIAYLGAGLLGIFVLFSSSFALSIPFILVMSVAWFVLVRRIYSFRFLSLFATFSVVLLIGEIPWMLAALSQVGISHRIEQMIREVSILKALSRWESVSVFDDYRILIMMGGLVLSTLGLGASRLRVRGILLTGIAVIVLLMVGLGPFPETMLWVETFFGCTADGSVAACILYVGTCSGGCFLQIG